MSDRLPARRVVNSAGLKQIADVALVDAKSGQVFLAALQRAVADMGLDDINDGVWDAFGWEEDTTKPSITGDGRLLSLAMQSTDVHVIYETLRVLREVVGHHNRPSPVAL